MNKNKSPHRGHICISEADSKEYKNIQHKQNKTNHSQQNISYNLDKKINKNKSEAELN